jgi:hypothetical protein
MGRLGRMVRLSGRLGAVFALLATLAFEPSVTPVALGQAIPQQVCGAPVSEAPTNIGTPDANGWTYDQAALDDPGTVRRYRFTVKQKGTALVYVGDQWYNLNLGLFSLVSGTESCWSVEARGASTESARRVLQFVQPDERDIDVDPGDYILTIRAGDAVGFDPSKKFTVRVAVGPQTCALMPPNMPTEYPGMTAKPDNPNKFQVGIAFSPSAAELGPFALMSFNANVSPPYTDLFDFAWVIDGQPVAGVTDPTILKPYSELTKTPDGSHTVVLTATGARPYKDPTDPRYDFTPFDGGSVSVTCTFKGPA